jgi:hypothetical protein
MEAKHRYRLLIYFAALILCLSVCFANAEVPTNAAPAHESHAMIFEQSHGHAAFMPMLQQSFVTPAVTAAEEHADEHVVPASVLQQVTDANRSHHFWRGSAKHHASLVLNHQVNTSSDARNDARDASNTRQSE